MYVLAFANEGTLPELPDWKSLDTIFALLPGLITYLLVRTFVVGYSGKIETSNAVLWGLASTVLVHTTWGILVSIPRPPLLFPVSNLTGLVLCSIGWAVLISIALNTDSLFRLLRDYKITREFSHAHTWSTSFHLYKEQYVQIIFEDGRRIVGYPRLYSGDTAEGHVLLAKSQWVDDTAGGVYREQNGPLLIRLKDVKSVEFL